MVTNYVYRTYNTLIVTSYYVTVYCNVLPCTATHCCLDDEDSDKEEQEEGFIAPEAVEAPVKGRK